MVIDTVAGNVQLSYLRRFLNEGFQTHLQNNELLHQASSQCPHTPVQVFDDSNILCAISCKNMAASILDCGPGAIQALGRLHVWCWCMQVFDFEPVQGRLDRSAAKSSNAAASRSRLKSRSAVAAYKGAMMAVED